MHLQEPEFLFLVHEWCSFARDPSQCIKTPPWILRRGLRAKVVLETDYLSRFWRIHARVSQASHQADSALTRPQEQKPQEPTRTSWPQEKGTWAISPNSCVSHPLHSHVFGYYSQSKYYVLQDWLWEACHKARVRWGARCKGFCSKEGPHYHFLTKCQESAGTQSGAKSAWEGVWQLSFRQATINLICKVRNPFTTPVPGCTALT